MTFDAAATPERLTETYRYKTLARLDAYYRGTQYDGRPDWWTGINGQDEQVPLRERKPCVIYPLPKAAVNQATRFTFGEGRFPTIQAEPLKAEDALRPQLAMDDAEAATLTKLIKSLCRQARLKSKARALMQRGLSTGTAVAVICIRRGRFTIDLPRAQDCTPTFQDDDPDGDVTALTWCYEFTKTVEEKGQLVERPYYYRRDVTTDEYVVYEDAPKVVAAYNKGTEWVRDEKRTERHGLGFCPVVWIRNAPESHCGDIDGCSIYAELEDEFDALNYALSQRHRGIHYFATPQAYETNVGDDEQPAGPPVRQAKKQDSYSDPVKSGPFGVNSKPARRLAPDAIWSYKGEAHIGMLETSGKAFEVATAHVSDIRSRILEAINVVLLDPSTIAGKGEMSAKALAILFAPLLALVDELREQWWEDGIEKILQMMLRIIAVRHEGSARGALLIPGSDKAAEILRRFILPIEDGTIWLPPCLTPTWGDYFSPTNKDVTDAVDAAEKAKNAQMITAKTATSYVAPYFGVADAAKEAEEAEGDTAETAQDKLVAELAALPPEDGPASDPEPPATIPEPGQKDPNEDS
jgi:hypothetical protein